MRKLKALWYVLLGRPLVYRVWLSYKPDAVAFLTETLIIDTRFSAMIDHEDFQ